MRRYFYPRSPCGERHSRRALGFVDPDISIHALLAESDKPTTRRNDKHNVFLSTLSLRRATVPTALRTPHQRFLSTLSLRRATQRHSPDSTHRQISIHALLAESDGGSVAGNWRLAIFLSTLSLRRATRIISKGTKKFNFYPRSPCGERPSSIDDLEPSTTHFYPRSPCGERLNGVGLIKHISGFLSTLSLRRATTTIPDFRGYIRNFYPRSPCGERRRKAFSIFLPIRISIHALLAESDTVHQ